AEEPRLWGRDLVGVEQGGELDDLRLPRRLDALEQRGEREADPRDDHRPGLHAPKRVDALLEWKQPDQLVDVERLGLTHEAVDLHRPRARSQGVAEPGRVVLVDA